MCGRYAAKKDPATLATEFEAVDRTGKEHRPDYNVAPTREVFTVVQRHPRDADGKPDPSRTERSLRLMKWGLVPPWAKDVSIGNKLINARSESAAEKPAFRSSVKSKRCIMPADGWYEWKREGRSKQPFLMTRADGASLAMAALWSTWRSEDAADDELPLVTCTVLTTGAVGRLTEIHDRMPLLLPESAWATWLDPDVADVADLLVPPSERLVDRIELRPVSDEVNNVRNNGPQLMEAVELDPDQATLL